MGTNSILVWHTFSFVCAKRRLFDVAPMDDGHPLVPWAPAQTTSCVYVYLFVFFERMPTGGCISPGW